MFGKVKRVGVVLAGVGGVLAPMAARAEGDIWTQGTAAVTGATTSVTALLITAVAIPAAFFGFRTLRKVFTSSN